MIKLEFDFLNETQNFINSFPIFSIPLLLIILKMNNQDEQFRILFEIKSPKTYSKIGLNFESLYVIT